MDEKLNEAVHSIWYSLTDEQKEKAKKCKSVDELALLAGKEGVELPDEAMDMVAGGGCGDDGDAPPPSDGGAQLPREAPPTREVVSISDNPFR